MSTEVNTSNSSNSVLGAMLGGSKENAPIFKGVIRGLLPLYILSLLGDRSRYGNEIMQNFAKMSGGDWKPSPGSIYPILKKLEKDGMIHGQWKSGRAAARRVYSITKEGRSHLPQIREQLLSELKSIRAMVERHIGDLESR